MNKFDWDYIQHILTCIAIDKAALKKKLEDINMLMKDLDNDVNALNKSLREDVKNGVE